MFGCNYPALYVFFFNEKNYRGEAVRSKISILQIIQDIFCGNHIFFRIATSTWLKILWHNFRRKKANILLTIFKGNLQNLCIKQELVKLIKCSFIRDLSQTLFWGRGSVPSRWRVVTLNMYFTKFSSKCWRKFGSWGEIQNGCVNDDGIAP